jgi:hypothetical protein
MGGDVNERPAFQFVVIYALVGTTFVLAAAHAIYLQREVMPAISEVRQLEERLRKHDEHQAAVEKQMRHMTAGLARIDNALQPCQDAVDRVDTRAKFALKEVATLAAKVDQVATRGVRLVVVRSGHAVVEGRLFDASDVSVGLAEDQEKTVFTVDKETQVFLNAQPVSASKLREAIGSSAVVVFHPQQPSVALRVEAATMAAGPWSLSR